jgi:hypothetical protein
VLIVDNFLDDLSIRSVDSLSGWDPLVVDFVLENVSGWSNLLVEVLDITSDTLPEILISLSGSSIVVGNSLLVVHLDMSWSFSGSWSKFSLGNLVVPGSGVHVLNSLSSDIPVFGISFKLFSGTVGVFHISFQILFDIPFEG